MATPRARAWVERLAWIAIYGGIFAIILGVISGEVHVIAGWSLGVLGGMAVAAGVVLIVVRSRMAETAAPGAQSNSPEGKP
ncbi:hypothetical protein [Ramlibacter sp. PS4R-6]|uniref:hypothetical protein n=1 Tax=Ramlibacter sp. PS4R-6 TaxID=3133438 RepID=UPI00309956FF